MNWFEGSTEAATTATTSKNAIFVVFISGNDEESERLATLITNDNIHKLLQSDDFVTLKAESDSLSYRQLASIYYDVPVPSIFFIGECSIPLEIITSQIKSAEELEEKIKNVLITSGREIPNTAESTTVPADSPMQPTTANCPGKDSSGSDNESDVTVDDKQAFFKKVEMKGTAEEMVDGHIEADKCTNVKMDENTLLPQHELQQIEETIRREKLEEESTLAEIAADRAETSQRPQPNLKMPADFTSNAATKAAGDCATSPEMIRIEFRFATGKNQTQYFKCDDTLEKVRNYVRISLLPVTGITDFSLATMYLKGEFGTEHDNQTLEELGLFHNGVILVIGKERASFSKGMMPVSGRFLNFLCSMVMIILSQIVELFQFIRNIATGGEVQGGGDESLTTEAAKRRSNRIRFGVPPAEANSDDEGDN